MPAPAAPEETEKRGNFLFRFPRLDGAPWEDAATAAHQDADVLAASSLTQDYDMPAPAQRQSRQPRAEL